MLSLPSSLKYKFVVYDLAPGPRPGRAIDVSDTASRAPVSFQPAHLVQRQGLGLASLETSRSSPPPFCTLRWPSPRQAYAQGSIAKVRQSGTFSTPWANVAARLLRVNFLSVWRLAQLGPIGCCARPPCTAQPIAASVSTPPDQPHRFSTANQFVSPLPFAHNMQLLAAKGCRWLQVVCKVVCKLPSHATHLHDQEGN